MKNALIRKGLKQRKKVAAQTDCNLHTVPFDAVLFEGIQEFHHGAIIPGIARNIHGKCVEVLHNMRLAVFLQFLKNLQLAHVENIV